MTYIHLTKHDHQNERSAAEDIVDAAAICTAAATLVSSDRARDYGEKVQNHRNIAGLWNAYLIAAKRTDIALTAHDVAIMMLLLKVGRTAFGEPKLDTYIDIAGYGAIAGEIMQRRGR